MRTNEYIKAAQDAFKEGKISEDAFWASIDNMEIFCDVDDTDYDVSDYDAPDAY